MLSAVVAYSSWLGSVHLPSSLKVLRQTTTGLTYLTVSDSFTVLEKGQLHGQPSECFHLVLLCCFVISTPPRDMLSWVP